MLVEQMPRPPLNLIEPRDAVQRVHDAFGCTGDEAVRFLCDRWLSGEISPRFTGGQPPGGADPDMADWFAGAIVEPDKWLPRRAVNEPGDDPEWQRIPGRSFPYRAALAVLPALLARWLPDGKWQGAEYVACNPKRADRRPGSFKINRNGRWADWAAEAKGGDVVSLAAYLAGISQAEAARELARALGIEST